MDQGAVAPIVLYPHGEVEVPVEEAEHGALEGGDGG
jgi:hypothetical protein